MTADKRDTPTGAVRTRTLVYNKQASSGLQALFAFMLTHCLEVLPPFGLVLVLAPATATSHLLYVFTSTVELLSMGFVCICAIESLGMLMNTGLRLKGEPPLQPFGIGDGMQAFLSRVFPAASSSKPTACEQADAAAEDMDKQQHAPSSPDSTRSEASTVADGLI
jgi:hypothetical protein